MKCHKCGYERKFSLRNPTMFCPKCGGFFARPKNFTPREEEEPATPTNELRHYTTPKPIDIYIA